MCECSPNSRRPHFPAGRRPCRNGGSRTSPRPWTNRVTMPGLPPKLVVTTYAPTRRWVTIVVLVLLVAGGVYGMFEFGRFRAGYDVVAGLKQRTELRNEISTLETTIFDLRAKVAQLESSTVGQTREREEVQRTIGDLQAQVARANQELAFFRGIVTQNANSAEVKIQQARMVATATANKFRIRVTLVQPMKPDTVVSGVVVLSVDGEVDGKPGRADFATLSGGKRREIPFTFRYLENIEEEITMPPGMKPEQLLVEVRSSRRGSAPVQQSYVWSVDPQ